jgi:sulfur carrier protein
MKITLNNNIEHFDAERMTVTELLAVKNYTFRMLVIRINDRLIPKDQYATEVVRDGDDVMVLHLISGG